MTPMPQPPVVLHGGSVWTGASLDEAGAHPGTPGGVLIEGGRLTAVGSDAELFAAAPAGARRVNLEGRWVLPGFVDAHVHLLSGGLDLARVDLRDVDTPEGFEARIREQAARTPPGGWIVAWGWNDHRWGGALPHRSWLDRAAPGHPVLALRTDLHVGVASTEALRQAGLHDGDPDPPRGTLDREADGRTLTGVLRERALEPVQARIPSPSEPERRNAIQAACRHALAHGVTQLHDMGVLAHSAESWRSLETLRALHAEGALPLRVLAAVPLDDRARMADEVAARGRGDLRLRWGAVKSFVDGSLGAATAWFQDPYAPAFAGADGSGCGGPVADLDALEAALGEAVALGLDPIVHAIGDRAVTWILGVYEAIARAHERAAPPRQVAAGAPGRVNPLRLRIEHVQHLDPSVPDLARRLANPALLCSMQPAHLTADGAWAESRIGAWRAPHAFAFRTLLDAGVPVAFGSDWTVAPLDPRAALAAAVTRAIDAPGRPVWGAAERIRLTEALRAHTVHAARGAFWEHATGTLTPGKEADVVILDRSPFMPSPDPEALEGLSIQATLVAGEVGWSAGALFEAESP